MDPATTDAESPRTHIYDEFSKALLEALGATHERLSQSCKDDSEARIAANYFHFFRRVISTDPEL